MVKNGADGNKWQKMAENGRDGKNGFPFVPLNYFFSPSFFFVIS
tara:strand:+ start:225 stop:356 length:132 start_codon:yes stop_codon:yes gene_type:complete